MQELIIRGSEQGQRIDKFLRKYLENASQGFLYKMLRKKNITLNGKRAEGHELLKKGDRISLFLSDETIEKFKKGSEEKGAAEGKTSANISIVYEDDNILLINKPVNLLVQPDRGKEASLADLLPSFLLESGRVPAEELRAFSPSPANRLDRNTTGIVCCGKTLTGQQFLSDLIKSRQLEKEYLAIAAGVLCLHEEKSAWAVKDPKTNTVRLSDTQIKAAVDMRTRFDTLLFSEEASLLKVGLITGRTHQIRAHLAFLGHPVIGDMKYGNEKTNLFYRTKAGVRRQMLHAYSVTFPELHGTFSHLSGKTIQAPAPPDFLKALQRMNLGKASEIL